MDITAFIRTPIVILALLLAVSACGPAKPVGPTPDELKRQAEQQELERLRAAEQERAAKEAAERQAAEEAKRKEEAVALPPEFGKPKPPDAAAMPPSETAPGTRSPGATSAPAAAVAAGGSAGTGGTSASSGAAPLIASSAAGSPEAPTVPYDQAFPPIPDRLLRVAVISAPSQANVAERIGTMLAVAEKDRLEGALGMGLQIAYLSQADRDPRQETRIQYREKYLQAAVRLASVIPQAQRVERMTESEANRMGVDVLIQVGADLR